MEDKDWVVIAEFGKNNERRALICVPSLNVNGSHVLAWVKRGDGDDSGVDKLTGKPLSSVLFLVEYDLGKNLVNHHKMKMLYKDGGFSDSFEIEGEWVQAEGGYAKEMEGIRKVLGVKPKKRLWPFSSK